LTAHSRAPGATPTTPSTLTSPLPLPDWALDSSPSIRSMPVGSVWTKARTGRSGATAATFASAFRAATRSEESVALYPFSACR
jgi:hypothetical protein